MPNYCECDLYVIGSTNDRSEFVKAITTNELTEDGESLLKICDTFIPCPKELLDTPSTVGDKTEKQKENIAKYGHADWYGWCRENWGTKWGDFNASVYNEGLKNTKIVFSTAWKPPLAAIKTISKMFPSLTFKIKYFERGQAFQGEFVVKNDIVSVDTTKPYRGQRGG